MRISFWKIAEHFHDNQVAENTRCFGVSTKQACAAVHCSVAARSGTLRHCGFGFDKFDLLTHVDRSYGDNLFIYVFWFLKITIIINNVFIKFRKWNNIWSEISIQCVKFIVGTSNFPTSNSSFVFHLFSLNSILAYYYWWMYNTIECIIVKIYWIISIFFIQSLQSTSLTFVRISA